MTPAPPDPPFTAPPLWSHCGHGAAPATDPVGCRGIRVPGHTACLAHLDETGRSAYLTGLSPGTDIDHRGTPFTPELLNQLLAALRDPATGRPHIGDARFDEASFSGVARFDKVSFSSYAGFVAASFSGDARFYGASFSGDAGFNEASFSGDTYVCASFSGDARFSAASFFGQARFGGASFSGDAWFDRASFSGDAGFGGASFSGDAWFDRASFSGDAGFGKARFEVTTRLGPLVCDKRVVLDGAVFQQPVTLEIAARQVSCARTRWASTATLHLRYAELDLRDAVLEYPVLVAARPTPFPLPHWAGSWPETELSGLEPGVHLSTVGGVDAAHLALHDIDLSTCRFAGAVHLDQLKVDGWCTFATTPTGWDRRFPWRWSRRNTLIEEHHWRVRTAHHPGRAAALGWNSPPQDAPELRPAAVAALYRQLRKSLEDGKNEPDAADFYYGECEMRRHDTGRPWGERALLKVYWALSGYGLRAARALGWLGVAMAVTVTVMMLWGLPVDDPRPATTGRQVAIGHKIVLTTDTPDPVNPTGPLTERVTTERLEKSLRVVINSVIFRSSGQDLTTTGTYTEMTSRLAEPVLLGLAVLAVRSRVKR
ncbi:pentapeptide repeat-containing protein [Streptomyces altiplanensis]